MKVLLVIALVLSTLVLAPLSEAKIHPGFKPTALRPASPELKSWSLGWRRVALRELAALNLARDAYVLADKRLAQSRPGADAPAVAWFEAGKAWRAKARDFHAREKKLRWRMSHPGGSGAARWAPLIRYYWPDHLVTKAVWVVSRESGGSPTARSSCSGAGGLFQLYPAPEGWSDPAINVRKAYTKYRAAGGWGPWASCGA